MKLLCRGVRLRTDARLLKWINTLIAVHAAIVICMLCSACSVGGIGQTLIPTRAGSATMVVRMIVTSSKSMQARTHIRRPAFISADTLGVKLVFSGAASATQYVDVSPGSAACGGSNASPRTCTVSPALVVGTYTIAATTYDAAPSAGTISASAHALATGTVTGATVTTGQTNMISIFLGGIVTAINPGSSFLSVPGDGATHLVGFAIAPTDFDAEAITAGSSDPYANPITATLTETGGSGHEVLYKNGVSVGSSTTLTQSTDSVQVHFDGGGATGYYGTVTLSASGATTQTFNVAPLYVSVGAYATGGSISFWQSGQTSTLSIGEATAPNTVTYTAPATSCTNVATASAVSGTSTASTVTVTAGTVASSTCTFAITDSLGTNTAVNVVVNLATTAASLAIPGTSEVAVDTGGAEPTSAVAGPDGNLWVTERSSNAIVKLVLATQVYTIYRTGLSAGANAVGIVSAPDGNLYFAENSLDKIGRINPTTHVITEYTGMTAGAMPSNLAVGADGNLWFCESGTTPRIGEFNLTTQKITEYSQGLTATNSAYYITPGADGNLYFTEIGTANKIGSINPVSHVIHEYSSGLRSNAVLEQIVSGPDNNIWFAEGASTPAIATLNLTTFAITEYTAGLTSGSKPYGITVGPDANIWFSENSSARFGNFNVSTHTITEYAGMTTGSLPQNIAVGADGSFYSPQFNGHFVARFTP